MAGEEDCVVPYIGTYMYLVDTCHTAIRLEVFICAARAAPANATCVMLLACVCEHKHGGGVVMLQHRRVWCSRQQRWRGTPVVGPSKDEACSMQVVDVTTPVSLNAHVSESSVLLAGTIGRQELLNAHALTWPPLRDG